MDAGVAFFRVLNYITEEYDITQAFLSMVSVSVPKTLLSALTLEVLLFSFKSVWYLTFDFFDVYREIQLSFLRNCPDIIRI